MSFLEIQVDEKSFGERVVLRHMDLALAQGEIASLVGPSGCGKSTLLSIVAGLDHGTPARASVRLDGVPLAQSGPDGGAGNESGTASGDANGHASASAVGVVFQEPRLFPWLDVARNIAFSGPGAPSQTAIADLLDEVGLAGYGAYLPRQLSGGQAQRVAIARALYTRPRVLLMDEPFSAVDAITRMKLQDLLARVVRERRLTVLLVTHDIDEAVHLSDHVILLDGQPGPPRARLPIPLARPRLRGDTDATALKTAILDLLDLEAAA